MGDRHGGCFARRGRALSPPRRDFPMARCGFPMPRGGGQDLPRAETLPTAKASRHGARAKGFAPRRNTPLGEGLPTRRTSERSCPAQERSLGEGLPTRRTGERICPAQKRSPRRRPPDTAHGRKNLPRARTFPTAKASRHGARAKGFAPRRNTPRGEGLPTRRTSEGICPAQKHAPRRRHPDTAHERRDLPRAETRPTCRRTAGCPRSTDSQKNTPSAGSHPQRAAAAEFIHRKK